MQKNGFLMTRLIMFCTGSLCFAHNSTMHKMILVIRKPSFYIYENKGADQLHGNNAADQHLCFPFIASTIGWLVDS